jgi:hypothetical protein
MRLKDASSFHQSYILHTQMVVANTILHTPHKDLNADSLTLTITALYRETHLKG